jgi:hypothetical protein
MFHKSGQISDRRTPIKRSTAGNRPKPTGRCVGDSAKATELCAKCPYRYDPLPNSKPKCSDGLGTEGWLGLMAFLGILLGLWMAGVIG